MFFCIFSPFKCIIRQHQVACNNFTTEVKRLRTTLGLCTALTETQLHPPRRDDDSRQGPRDPYRLHRNDDRLNLNAHDTCNQMAAGDTDTLNVDFAPNAFIPRYTLCCSVYF